mmetsp:Transcript_11975/g.19977  ORF Transcript_11975/g.19977 Transcript_11975/m.19977 type:complete len:175 (+) Transcript_11975:113-637(+)
MMDGGDNNAAFVPLETINMTDSGASSAASRERKRRGALRRRLPGGERYYRELPWTTGSIRQQVQIILHRRRKAWMVMGIALVVFVSTDLLLRLSSYVYNNNGLFWTVASTYLAAFFGFFLGMHQELKSQWALDELISGDGNLPDDWDDESDTEVEGGGDAVGTYEAPNEEHVLT